MLLYTQTFWQEINSQGGERQFSSFDDLVDPLCFNFFQQLFFGFCLPRSFSCEHFEEYDTNRPEISFVGILISFQRFGSHVQWGSNIVLAWFKELRSFDCETKISYFTLVIVSQQDIGWFEITMDNFFLVNLQISLDDLIHEMKNLIVCWLVFNLFVQVTTTKFRNDVCVIFCCINLVKCEHVGDRFKFFKDVDLRLEKGSIDFILQHFHINDFDCHRLF